LFIFSSLLPVLVYGSCGCRRVAVAFIRVCSCCFCVQCHILSAYANLQKQEFAKSLYTYKLLEKLDVSHCNIGAKGIGTLLEALQV